jgi:hypothetical protein
MRVGLIVDSFFQPHWIHAIVGDIQSSSLASISVVVIRNTEETLQEVPTNSRSLLYCVYNRLDNFKTRCNSDALEKMNLQPLVSDCPVIEVRPTEEREIDRYTEEDINKIRSFDLDVALYFGSRILKGEALNIAKHGTWSHHYGATASQQLAAFWEVMEDTKITSLSLRVLAEEPENVKTLYSSISPLGDRFSAKLNRNDLYWKLSAMVMRKLKELQRSGLTFQPTVNWKSDNSDTERVPTNAEMARPLTRLLGRYFTSVVEHATTFTQWSLAYKFGKHDRGFQHLFDEVQFLIPPSDRFWADPFPVKASEKYYIFIEERLLASPKGHIAVMELDEEGNWNSPVKVLERDYHLSYPCSFEWKGDYYMIPETLGNKTVELYRCTSFPLVWELDRILIPNINATDATIMEVDDLWWIFVNVAERDFPVDWNELYLYYADSPNGEWKPHPGNPVKLDARGSRPAGRLFRHDGALYRPAQDSSKRYGYAISLNRVLQLDPERYAEEEISRILPREDKNMIGTHTINSADELTVLDCLLRRKRFF